MEEQNRAAKSPWVALIPLAKYQILVFLEECQTICYKNLKYPLLLLAFPSPVPPGWWQMCRREISGSSLAWWGMRQSGKGLDREGKNSSRSQAVFYWLVGSSAKSGHSCISVLTGCCCCCFLLLPCKARLDLNHIK